MVWTVPQTAVVGEVVRAAFWNVNVRDNFRVFNITNIQADQVLLGLGPGSWNWSMATHRQSGQA